MTSISLSRPWPLSLALALSVTGTAGTFFGSQALARYGAIVVGRDVDLAPLERVKLWFSAYERTKVRQRAMPRDLTLRRRRCSRRSSLRV